MPHYAGFDIGGTNARVSIYDEAWNKSAEVRETIRDRAEPKHLAQTVRNMLVEATGLVDEAPNDLSAVGIGLAGQLDKTGQFVVNSPNLGWRDIDFGSLLSESLEDEFGDLHIHILNDLNALLWGEHIAGAVAGIEDVLAVYVGTGIGGAILVDGRLVIGAGGKGGEIGHSKVVPGGRLCGCGERGCVEAYAGGVHLERMSAEIAGEESLDEVLGTGEVFEADLQAADRLAARGHQAFDELWRSATDYLALITANACTLLNPSVLLFGGGVLENLEEFRMRVLQKTPPLILAAARGDVEIRLAQLGNDAGMLGAARLAAARAELDG